MVLAQMGRRYKQFGVNMLKHCTVNMFVKRFEVTTDVTELTQPGLTTCTTYNVTVTAVNDLGECTGQKHAMSVETECPRKL